MASGGGAFSPEEVAYLRSLPAVVAASRKRITYSDAFKEYCIRQYNEGASPVKLFREAGLDPALIGHKRIEHCFARWRQSFKAANDSTGTGARRNDHNSAGGGVSDAASDPHAASADGTEFNVDSGKRVIVVPGRQSNEPDDDVRDLLIAQQVRRIDELEHRVEMLNIILRKRRAKSRPCDIADDDGTAAADDSTGTDASEPSAA